jgi:hypothetical protein
VTIVAVTTKLETEDQHRGVYCILEFVFARLNGSSWFGGVAHLANECSLLVLQIRDGVIVLQVMSISSTVQLCLNALESSR